MCSRLIEQKKHSYPSLTATREWYETITPISGVNNITDDKHEQGREIWFWKRTLTGLDLAEAQTLLPHSQHCVCSQGLHNLGLPGKANKHSEIVTLMQKTRVEIGLLMRYEERLQRSCLI